MLLLELDLLHDCDTKPWVARIKGPCPKFRLEREFIRGAYPRNGRTGPGRTTVVRFECAEGEIYELCEPKRGGTIERSFIRVVDGRPVFLEIDEVLEAVRAGQEVQA